jgi:hypothetical protein
MMEFSLELLKLVDIAGGALAIPDYDASRNLNDPLLLREPPRRRWRAKAAEA